jgi:hypothetical protein
MKIYAPVPADGEAHAIVTDDMVTVYTRTGAKTTDGQVPRGWKEFRPFAPFADVVEQYDSGAFPDKGEAFDCIREIVEDEA